MGRRYRNRRYYASAEPKWMTARFGNCAECGAPMKGKRGFWVPLSRDMYCEEHGTPRADAYFTQEGERGMELALGIA